MGLSFCFEIVFHSFTDLKEKCSFSKVTFLCILIEILQWQFRFSRNCTFPSYNGHLVSFANSLRSSSFYKSEAKFGTNKFFIRASNFNLRLSFLTSFFHKKPSKWSSSSSMFLFLVSIGRKFRKY